MLNRPTFGGHIIVGSVFFILYIYWMKKIMKEKNQVVPDEVLNKEFLSLFKTEADVSKFLRNVKAADFL